MPPASYKPQDGRGHRQPCGKLVSTDGAEMDTGSENQNGRADLAEKLLPRLEAEDVINETGRKDQKGGWGESPNEAEVPAQDLAALKGQEQNDGEGSEIGNDYGDPADSRDRAGMHFAAVVRTIQQTPTTGEVPAGRCKNDGGNEGRDGEYE